MKKLITLALAAFAVSASALEIENISMERIPAPAKPAFAAAAPSYAATASDLTGNYFLEIAKLGTSGIEFGNPGMMEVSVLDNQVIINNFIYEGVSFTGTFDSFNETVTFPLGQECVTDDGSKVTMYEYDWITKSQKPVVFRYDAASKTLYYEYRTSGGYIDSAIRLAVPSDPMKSIYAQIYLVYAYYTNSIMAYRQLNATTNEYSDPKYVPINVYRDGTEPTAFHVDNFLGRGFLNPVMFVTDAEYSVAYVTNQLMATEDGVMYYLWDFDTTWGQATSTTVGFQGQRQDNGDWQFSGGIVGILNEEGKEPLTANDIYAAPNLIVPFDPFNASVSSVGVSDENAPVEFFNLQGVRVANPENGLYIRRQGKSVQKIYVK
ncbi:MAG: hypothetical protein K2L84_01820 [Muribaculaceae bacterium]|nr:hypothetical protein [Muribaculaceae bacterium]